MKTLQQELDQMNSKRNQVKSENTVKADFPVIKRTYSYRKSATIKASDIEI